MTQLPERRRRGFLQPMETPGRHRATQGHRSGERKKAKVTARESTCRVAMKEEGKWRKAEAERRGGGAVGTCYCSMMGLPPTLTFVSTADKS